MGAGETKKSVGFVSANASFGDWKFFHRDRFKCHCRVRPRRRLSSLGDAFDPRSLRSSDNFFWPARWSLASLL
jgi:hypothetical protein